MRRARRKLKVYSFKLPANTKATQSTKKAQVGHKHSTAPTQTVVTPHLFLVCLPFSTAGDILPTALHCQHSPSEMFVIFKKFCCKVKASTAPGPHWRLEEPWALLSHMGSECRPTKQPGGLCWLEEMKEVQK